MTESDLAQADERAWLLQCDVSPSIGSTMNVETEAFRYTDACPNTQGCRSRSWRIVERLAKGGTWQSVPVCCSCGTTWERWEAVGWRSNSGPRGGWDGGFTGRLRAGRTLPEQSIHLNPTRPSKTSTEHLIFGDRESVRRLIAVQILGQRYYRSPPWFWHARMYFAYVLGPGARRGNGGLREVADAAQARWPRAPFEWTYYRVRDLVDNGRPEWARRLDRAGLLWGEVEESWQSATFR